MPDKLTVILADGDFPVKDEPVSILKSAHRIICCDGAAASLVKIGLEPDFIVGDLDSLSDELKEKFADRLIRVREQETNDLTKAFNFCRSRNWNSICILGATGKREDHTIGNLSLLADYSKTVPSIRIVTNYGTFFAVSSSCTILSKPGQQISIFALTNGVRVSSRGLKYPLDGLKLDYWWQATLNEAVEESFELDCPDNNTLLLFQEHPKKRENSPE